MAKYVAAKQLLSARVSYAISLYVQYLPELGARAAYETAMTASELTAPERTEFRNAIYTSQR